MISDSASQAAPIAGIVIAGGHSRRMGQDKRRLRLWGDNGPTLLEHTLAVLAPLCAELIVVLNDAEHWPQLLARIVGDVYAEGGALGGIYSGLQAAQHEHALVVAADMPLLNVALLRWMIERPRGYDVLVPQLATSGQARNRRGVESLHAIYSRACLAPIARQLDAGNPQVIGFFDDVRVELIAPATLAQLDPQGLAFSNVNTPEELARVQQIIAQDQVK